MQLNIASIILAFAALPAWASPTPVDCSVTIHHLKWNLRIPYAMTPDLLKEHYSFKTVLRDRRTIEQFIALVEAQPLTDNTAMRPGTSIRLLIEFENCGTSSNTYAASNFHFFDIDNKRRGELDRDFQDRIGTAYDFGQKD